jgi:hypothetical protein
MPVYDPTLTAQKAAETLPQDALNASGHSSEAPAFIQTKGYIDATRKGRKGPQPPPELEITREFKKQLVHVFNVGPWAHVIPCGSAGTFYIPACPEGQPYIEMLTPLHVLEEELYPTRDKREYKRLQDEGRKMAVEILGEGRNQDRKQSKRHAGVFIAAGDTPTEKEIYDANAQLHALCSQMDSYMMQLWDRDRKLAYDVFHPRTYGAASRVLGLTGKDRPYLAQGAPLSSAKCPACRSAVDPEAAICANCGGVVNEEAWVAIEARKQQLLATVAPTEKKAK